MKNRSKMMRKIAAAMGICASLVLGAAAAPLMAEAATSNVDGAMIRNEPSTDAGIIGSLYEGDEVTILGSKQSGDGYTWYYIQLDNGNTGYVRGDLLNVDDSELESIGLEGEVSGEEEAQETEEAAQEPEEEAVETGEEAAAEENTEAEQAPEQAAQEPEQEAAEQPQETAPAEPAADGSYDASKDPNANLRLVYENGENGSGSWYVYNDDNGTKIRVGEMTASAQQEQPAQAGAGPWKTAAIVFGIIAIALAAFVLFMLKSIRDDRNNSARRRAARENNDNLPADSGYEEDEFFFVDGEEEIGQDADELSHDPETFEDSTLTVEEPEEIGEDEIPDVTAKAAAFAEEDFEEPAGEEDIPFDEAPAEEEPDEVTEVLPEEEPWQDAVEPETEEAGMEQAPNEAAFEDEIPGDAAAEEVSEEYYEQEDYPDEEEEAFDEGSEDYGGEGDPDSEEYSEEDYEEDFEDYDDDSSEEFEDGAGARSSKKSGGVSGFLRKLFGTDSREDVEDDYEDDEYADDEEFVFDEYKEYPEDVDLLPREEAPLDDADDLDEEPLDEGDAPRERLSVQRVMKNAGKENGGIDIADSALEELDDEQLSEPLFDEDDDMEYSFLGNRRRR